MKSISHTRYGPPDELKIIEIPKPVPGDNEVLVKINASSVTSSDCNMRNFTFAPKSFQPMAKLVFGISKPRNNKLGIEFSGTIENVGKNVQLFKPGDKVYGTPGAKLGAYAQYLCMPASGILSKKPEKASFNEAAVIALAANTALYFIRDLGKIKPGQKVLIHGASGAIGTFAVQLAKYYGAEVTGVCSGSNAEMVKSLGADNIIDYTKEDFTATDERFDAVFSVVGKTSYTKCKKIMKKKSVYLENYLEVSGLFTMLGTALFSGKKFIGGMAVDKVENLKFLTKLIDEGHLKSVIDKVYPLEQIVDAFRYVEGGHKKGNVVIKIEE